MSRHSHWAKIKKNKGTEDAKRGAVFTKLSRLISIAAKDGGADPEMNFKLRLAIDAAKSANMPKDTIERAVARGAGTGEDGELSEVTYEAIGPAGVGLMIEAVTDNKNRTSATIKHTLSKYDGGLGGPGSVAWQFDHKGIVRVSELFPERSIEEEAEGNIEAEALELELIEAGAEDIKKEDNGLTIQVAVDGLQTMLEYLHDKQIEVEYSGLEWVAKQSVPVDEETRDKLTALIGVLEDDEDVSSVFSNEA